MIELPRLDWVAVDVEASGLFPDDGARVSCVGLVGSVDGRRWSAGLPFDQGERSKIPAVQMDMFDDGVDPNLSEEDWVELLDWLEKQQLVFHNAKYDLTMLAVGLPEKEGRDLTHALLWDTMLANKELDPLELTGLDASAKRLGLGRKTDKDEVKTWLKKHRYPTHRYDLVPWHIIKPYVLGDAELTADLYEHQQARFASGEAEYKRMFRELELATVLFQMEQRGVGYDWQTSAAAADVLEAKAAEIEERMPFKCTPNDAKRYFIDELGLMADRSSEKTGEPSVDEEQVRKWAAEGVEWAKEYAEVTKRRRAVSMWYRGYPAKKGRDDRLRTSYKQAKVKSGRMSVERVQLQAIPKADKMFEEVPHVRALLRAEEGYGLWNLDLSQAELRVAARYAKCQLMLEELASDNPDIHGRTTEQVMKIPRDHPLWKEKRDIGKRLTFGGIFQIGGEKFQKTLARLADIHLPLEECDALVAEWRAMYPEFGQAYYRARNKVRTAGHVRLLPNTRYESKSWFAKHEDWNAGWNRIVQGSLAEFFKLWMIEIERKWSGRMILTIHDSVLLEMPLGEGDEIAKLIAARGAEMATELFDIEMKVDTDRWDAHAMPAKQYDLVKGGGVGR